MIFSEPNKNIPVLQLRINNANIDEVQNFNFLGLQVSSDITWNLHINEISKKISRIKKRQFERSPVQDTFLIPSHYLNPMIF